MRKLLLTSSYTLYGLDKDEYENASFHINLNITSTDAEEREVNKLLFKSTFNFDIDTIVGDGILTDGARTIPLKIATQLVETAIINNTKVYKCYMNRQWKHSHFSLPAVHEDEFSSLNCALKVLHDPYAIIIQREENTQ